MANMEMTIDNIMGNQMNYQRVVILREKDRNQYLPIWIGPAEGDAIAMKLQGVSPPGPQTQDFACAKIDALGGSLESVVIHKLENDNFYAKVIVGTRKSKRK